jgi:hypothetical protein
MLPGDIVKIKSIDDCEDSQGYHWCLDDNGWQYRLIQNLTKNEVRELRAEIHNNNGISLVCIQEKINDNQPAILTNSEYENFLIDYYYTDSWLAKHKKVQLARWKGISLNSKKLNYKIPREDHIFPEGKASLVFVENPDQFILPVFCSKYCEAIAEEKNNYLFTSAPQFIHRSIFPGCTKSNFDEMPIKLKGFVNFSGQVKEVVFYVYGFLRPENFHYHFWKHCYAATPSATGVAEESNFIKEQLFWKMKYNLDFKMGKNPFIKCKENKDQTGCIECSNENFNTIEHNDKISDLIDLYFSCSVTFLKEATTKAIYHKEYKPPLKWNEFSLVFTKKFRFAFGAYDEIDRTLKLIMAGASYNWNDVKPIIHLYYRTFYFDNRHQLLNRKQRIRIKNGGFQTGEIEKVSNAD